MKMEKENRRGFYVIVDTKEQSRELKEFADEVRPLEYANPVNPSHAYTYDIELHTNGGQVLTFERKKGADAIASFHKLDRQTGPVDAIILEGFHGRHHPFSAHLLPQTRKRLWRLAFTKAILPTADVGETIELLTYLGRKEEVIDLREPLGESAW